MSQKYMRIESVRMTKIKTISYINKNPEDGSTEAIVLTDDDTYVVHTTKPIEVGDMLIIERNPNFILPTKCCEHVTADEFLTSGWRAGH